MSVASRLEEVLEAYFRGDRLARLRVWVRIVGLVRPYRLRLLLSVLALLVGSGLSLLYPQLVRRAVDLGLSQRSSLRLDGLVWVFLGLVLLQSLVVWIRHYLMGWIGQRAVADLRTRVYRHLLSLPCGWFHARRSGNIVGRLSGDVMVLESVVGSELALAVGHLVQLVGGVAFLLVLDPWLTAHALVVVPPLVLATLLLGRKIGHQARRMYDHLAEASAHVQESVSAIETVKAFRREAALEDHYRAGVERAFEAGVSLAHWRASFFAGTALAGSCGVAVLLWLGGREVIAERISAGDLVAFLMYSMTVAGGLSGLANLWGALQRAGGATLRLFQLLDTFPAIREPAQPRALPPGGGELSFEGVSFSYPGSADRCVLHDLSLRVGAGQVVALVGPSGGGKTTLTALALRLYDVDRGVVRFEGEDVRQLSLFELRRHVAIVAQDPVLFHGTARDNIALARPEASLAEVEAAARDAHADAFIRELPLGYDTPVGERGVRLSGGQRQRIAIARALLSNPRLLILDEATSNLDAESEALVQQGLARLMHGRTSLVIAHRLSTVMGADRIVVLDQGRLLEQGRHEDLMVDSDMYRRLVHHQLRTLAERSPAA